MLVIFSEIFDLTNGTQKRFWALKVSNICQQMFHNNSEQHAIQLVSYHLWQLFFEAKKLSHIKSMNEMIGKDVDTFMIFLIILCWFDDYVMRGDDWQRKWRTFNFLFTDVPILKKTYIFCAFQFLFQLKELTPVLQLILNLKVFRNWRN